MKFWINNFHHSQSIFLPNLAEKASLMLMGGDESAILILVKLKIKTVYINFA